MKIDFRKAPQNNKDFSFELNSVKFFGTFGKISSSLVDIDSTITGNINIECCKCGENVSATLDEKINFLVSDGIYSSNDERDLNKIIIEVSNNIIDFEEILQSELESFKSDYHMCDDCKLNDSSLNLTY